MTGVGKLLFTFLILPPLFVALVGEVDRACGGCLVCGRDRRV